MRESRHTIESALLLVSAIMLRFLLRLAPGIFAELQAVPASRQDLVTGRATFFSVMGFQFTSLDDVTSITGKMRRRGQRRKGMGSYQFPPHNRI